MRLNNCLLMKVISPIALLFALVLIVLGILMAVGQQLGLHSSSLPKPRSPVRPGGDGAIPAHLPPTAPPIPTFVPGDDDVPDNLYAIECSDTLRPGAPAPPWLSRLNASVHDGVVGHACYNSELAQAIFFVDLPTRVGGQGAPSIRRWELRELDYAKLSFHQLSTGERTDLGGCGRIVAWTRSHSLYYECAFGEGVVSSTRFRLNLNTRLTGIIAECSSGPQRPYCSTYCSADAACPDGFVCNPRSHNCLKSCAGDLDCQSFGPATCYTFPSGKRGCW